MTGYKKTLTLFLIVLAIFLVTGCIGNFIYHPQKELTATPADVGLKFESVSFPARDGVMLSGWWVPASSQKETGKEERGVLLFCHGNAGNISHRLDSLLIFNQLGLSVFIFDYRGFGLSEGKPTEEGTYLDAEAAREYLVNRRRVPPERIIVFGRSLGGAIAARLARSPCRGLILESAFISIREVAGDHAPWVPGFILSGYGYQTGNFVRECASPTLVIHSPDDEVIRYRHGLELYRAAGNPRGFLKIRGPHNRGFLQSLPVYKAGLEDFLSSLK